MSRGNKIVNLVLTTKEKCLQDENQKVLCQPHGYSLALNPDLLNYDEINQPSTSSGVYASMSINSSPERSDSSSFPTTTKGRRYIVYSSDNDSSNECPVQELRVTIEIRAAL